MPKSRIGRGRNVSLTTCVFVFLGFVQENAWAQWDFELQADFGAIYTDNLRLDFDGFEQEELVFTVAPIITLINQSDRLTANIGYRAEGFFYTDAPESDSVFHTVDASATTELVRNALFVTFNGAKFQTQNSTDGRFPTTNLPITGNRIDSVVLGVRPYWEQDFGFAEILAAYSYGESRLDPESQMRSFFNQDSTDQIGQLSLNNHNRHQGFAWGIAYDYQRVEYENALPFEFQTAAADIGYWFGGLTRLFLSGGIETPFDSFLDASLDEEFWEAGFQYSPNQRFDAELAFGERSFGDTYRARVSLQLRRGSTLFTYNEGATTRANIAVGRRPIFAQDAFGSILDRPGESDRFVQKRGRWQTDIKLARSDISVSLFSEERVQRSTDDGSRLDNERMLGASFRWAWRFGPNSALGLVANVGERSTEFGDSEITGFSIDYNFQFSQRLGIVIVARHSKESGGVPNVALDYTENQVSLNLRTRL